MPDSWLQDQEKASLCFNLDLQLKIKNTDLKKHENTTNSFSLFFFSINKKYMAERKLESLSGAVEEHFSCSLSFYGWTLRTVIFTSAEYSSVPNNLDRPAKDPSDQLDFINSHQYITKHYGQQLKNFLFIFLSCTHHISRFCWAWRNNFSTHHEIATGILRSVQELC